MSTNTNGSQYARYILQLFSSKEFNPETISSLGNTISKAVSVAEMVRHRVPGLHQESQISTQVL
jgi:DNA-binding protein